MSRGQAVYDTCRPCHGANGEGNEALGAPQIAGLPQWYIETQLNAFREGWRGFHPMDTVGIRMRSMERTLDMEGDLESVAQFVASMPRHRSPETLNGNAQVGEQLYTTNCTGCHMPTGLGLEATSAPPLVGQHDWYLLAQYEKYVKGWRGADSLVNLPSFQMKTTGSQQASVAQVVDILAYIQTLPLTAEQGADE